MSYFPHSPLALGVTSSQQKVLLDIPEEELRALPADTRLELVMRKYDVKASESSARWNAIATFVTVAVPIAAVFGISLAAKDK